MVVTISHLTEKKLKKILEKDKLTSRDKNAILKGLNYYRDKAYTDDMTELPNERYFYERLIKEIDRTLRGNKNIVLSIYDADEFKEINDNYGHMTAGDRVLWDFANFLKKDTRSGDILARRGTRSDEFLRAFVNMDKDIALRRNDEFLKMVRNMMVYEFVNIGSGERKTVNVGFTSGTSFFNEDGVREYATLLYGKRGRELLNAYLDSIEGKRGLKDTRFQNMIDNYIYFRKKGKKETEEEKVIKTLNNIRNSGIEYTKKEIEFYKKVSDPYFLKELATYIFLDIADKRLLHAKSSKKNYQN